MVGKEYKSRGRPRKSNGQFESLLTRKWRIVGYAWIVIGVLYIITTLLDKYNEWSYENEMQRPYVFNVEFYTRPWVVKREPRVVIAPFVEEEDRAYEELTDLEKQIVDKWGLYEGKIAVAVAKAESGLNPEAIHYNTNGTYDAGLFQINSIHWDKCGGLKALLDVENNLDCAYQIWEDSGWNPWTVFKTGAFRGQL